MDFVARFLGRTLAYTYEVVEHGPHQLVMRTAQGPFPMETTYTWQPEDTSSTRMTLRNRGEPAGYAKVMAAAMHRANQRDLARLKQIMESAQRALNVASHPGRTLGLRKYRFIYAGRGRAGSLGGTGLPRIRGGRIMAASVQRSGLLSLATAGMLVLATATPSTATATATATSSPARTYTYVDLGLLPGVPVASGRSSAQGVNATGQVVGTSNESGRVGGVAVVFRGGRWVSLGSLLNGYFAASFGSGINDAGVVVGYTHVSSKEPPHGFVYRNGRMTDLGTGFGSGSVSRATAINSGGLIVGIRSASQLGTTRAAVWSGGLITDLPGLSRLDSEAAAVNDAGQVVGVSRTASGAWRAVLWTNGRVTDLGTLGSDHEAAAAHDISNTGSVVGTAPAPGQQVHAFLWQGGVMRDPGTLPGGDGFSSALGVNGHDQAVGVATVPGGPFDNRNRAVLFEGGQVIDLNTRVVNLPATVSLSTANAINDTGVIVGNSCFLPCDPFRPSGTAFMLIPNP